VLCRTNGGVLESALSYQERGLKVGIVGGGKDILSFAYAATKAMRGEGSDHPEIGIFKSWNEVCEHAEQPEGKDIRMLVRLVNTYGVQAIIDVCNTSVDEGEADVIVSTAHKAKGREWGHVRIHTDFPEPKENEDGERKVSRTDAMLAYVAVTRAQKVLDNVGLSWVSEFVS
jgi:hypothetical protein